MISSTEEAVKLCRGQNLDIAINLTGFHENHRMDIFMERIAPIQINYLGYPGTLAQIV